MDFAQRPLSGFTMRATSPDGTITEASVTDLSVANWWTTLHLDAVAGTWRFGKVDTSAEFVGDVTAGVVFHLQNGLPYNTLTEHEQVTVDRVLEHLGTLVGKAVQVGNVAPDFTVYTVLAIDTAKRGAYLWRADILQMEFLHGRKLIERLGGYNIVQYR